MKLYLYDTRTKKVLAEIEGVESYTDSQVVTPDGTYSPLAEHCELSATPDCTETLRADWRSAHPSAETRIEELEALMAEVLFGGEVQ